MYCNRTCIMDIVAKAPNVALQGGNLMTNQEKKAYLMEYSKCNEKINILLEELYTWETRATKITAVNTGMPKGGQVSDKVGSSVLKILQIKEKIQQEIDAFSEIANNVYKAINSLNDPTLEALMLYRYIQGLTWEQIALKMNYNYRWVLRLHNKALTQMAIN